MALTFNTPLTTPSGIAIDNAYGRVSVLDDKTGTTLQIGLAIYVSEEAFNNSAEEVAFPSLSYAQVAYDRMVDGTDVLDLAHDTLISQLAQVGISATKSL